MARITVELPSLLGDVLGGLRQVQIEAETLQEAFAELIQRQPMLGVHLQTETGALRRHIRCFLNDRDIRQFENLDVTLSEGDTITILQAISGGLTQPALPNC